MAFHLAYQIPEERDRMGGHDRVCRYHHFQEAVRTLKRGLRHEPGNSLLTQRLEKRELELAKEQDIHDLMNMVDRLDPESDIEILKGESYIPEWVWDQRE